MLSGCSTYSFNVFLQFFLPVWTTCFDLCRSAATPSAPLFSNSASLFMALMCWDSDITRSYKFFAFFGFDGNPSVPFSNSKPKLEIAG